MVITSVYLKHNERPRFMYCFFVTGSGEFPTDMLRYDKAWPVSAHDADYIMMSDTHRCIELHSYKRPSQERWSSFSWLVTSKDTRLVEQR